MGKPSGSINAWKAFSGAQFTLAQSSGAKGYRLLAVEQMVIGC